MCVKYPKRWLPEHAPIGSLISYRLPNGEEGTTKVLGHGWNGVDSWVAVVDQPCPTFHWNPDAKRTFNGDHIVDILERGKGGVNYVTAAEKWNVERRVDYTDRLANIHVLGVKPKGKNYYRGYSLMSIVQYALTVVPSLHQFSADNDHIHDLHSDLANKLHDLIIPVKDSSIVIDVNKRKLIKRLKQLAPKSRVSVKSEIRRERELDEKYYLESLGEDD